jgi:hypothetical protein
MPAEAGAWIAPKGGQRITTELAGQRDERFYSESSYYLEAPFDEDISLVASPWLGQNPESYGMDALRWEVTLAGKVAVRRDERSVMAVQAGVVWNSEPLAECAEAALELRWLAGRSIGQRSFANVEIAERASDEGCGGERLDVTLGRRFDERWLGLGQIFIDQPRFGDGSAKLQMSLVRFGADDTGVQIGFRARVDGEELEPALVLGFWGRANP